MCPKQWFCNYLKNPYKLQIHVLFKCTKCLQLSEVLTISTPIYEKKFGLFLNTILSNKVANWSLSSPPNQATKQIPYVETVCSMAHLGEFRVKNTPSNFTRTHTIGRVMIETLAAFVVQ